MSNWRMATPRARRRAIAASVLLSCLLFAGGCKTSDDAKAAASQLTATAKSLTDYYAALDTMLSENDQVSQIHEAVNPVATYTAQAKATLADTRSEIQKREVIAKDLTGLAQQFAALSGSSAATDVPASAAKLESGIEGLKLTKFKMSSPEQAAMKLALEGIVKAVQEHKEREAAQQIDKFTSALAEWFNTESDDYNSIGRDYASATSSLAHTLLRNHQADLSPFLKPALDPYGIAPELTDSTIRTNIEGIADKQIDQKAAALVDSQQSATASMEKALKEMADRIKTVADDKPMAMRTAPITLTDVEKWASQFTSAATPTSKTATDAK